MKRIEADSESNSPLPVLPRPVMRHLLTSHHIGLGSRVLDVGCGDGGLVAYLAWLGIDAVGYDADARQVELARQQHPLPDFHTGGLAELQTTAQPFQLIVVRDLEATSRQLFSLSAFTATAHLLSCLSPGGHLVFLTYVDTNEQPAPRQRITDYAKHLAAFPGTYRVSRFQNRLTRQSTWSRLLHGKSVPGYRAAAVHISQTPAPPAEWLRLARLAACQHQDDVDHSDMPVDQHDTQERRRAA